jgi:hypothetical protein
MMEGQRLRRSPLVLGAAVLVLVELTAQTWTGPSVWEVVAAKTRYAVIPLALAAMLAAHVAATRDHHYGMDEITRTLPTPASRRAAALLVVLPATALVTAAVVGVGLASLIPAGFAGRFDPWDLLGSVTVPVFAAATGCALAGWLRSITAGILGTLAVGMVVGVLNFVLTDPGSRLPLVSPVLPIHAVVGHDVPSRLTGWHLLYLLGLTTAAIGATLIRYHRPLPAIAIAAGLAVAVTAGAVKIGSYPLAMAEAHTGAAITADRAGLNVPSRGSNACGPVRHRLTPAGTPPLPTSTGDGNLLPCR